MRQRKLVLASRVEPILQKLSFVFPKPAHDLKTIWIPTAANVEKETVWLDEEKAQMTKVGFNLIACDIALRKPVEISNALADADVIYVSGGNSYYLLDCMRKTDIALPLTQFLDRGGTYIGTSAGAVVTCPDIGFIADLDDPSAANLTDHRGLGLIQFKLLPHLDHEIYGPKIRQILRELASMEPVIGLREDQVAYVRDDFIEIF